MLFFLQNFFSFICFLSLPLALSVISMSVYTSKCSGKRLAYVFFHSKNVGGQACGKCDTWDHLTCRGWMIWMNGWTDGHMITKISEIYRLPFFLAHGAPPRARESSTKNVFLSKFIIIQPDWDHAEGWLDFSVSLDFLLALVFCFLWMLL